MEDAEFTARMAAFRRELDALPARVRLYVTDPHPASCMCPACCLRELLRADVDAGRAHVNARGDLVFRDTGGWISGPMEDPPDDPA